MNPLPWLLSAYQGAYALVDEVQQLASGPTCCQSHKWGEMGSAPPRAPEVGLVMREPNPDVLATACTASFIVRNSY